ncbi:MAG: tetratricopeptide repeat protein, partial [Bacteroidia bacterium]
GWTYTLPVNDATGDIGKGSGAGIACGCCKRISWEAKRQLGFTPKTNVRFRLKLLGLTSNTVIASATSEAKGLTTFAESSAALVTDVATNFGLNKLGNSNNANGNNANRTSPSNSTNPKEGEDDKFLKLGDTYLEAKEYQKAIEMYNKALTINSDNSMAYFGKGMAYFGLEDYDNALEMFLMNVGLDGKHPSTSWLLAQCYKAKGNFSEAITHFEYYLKNGTNFEAEQLSSSYATKALCHIKLNQYDMAKEEIKNAFRKQSDNREAKVVDAILTYKTNNVADAFEKVITTISQIEVEKRFFPNLHFMKADLCSRINDHQQAIEAYQKVREAFEDNFNKHLLIAPFEEIYYGLAFSQYRTFQYDNALENANRALATRRGHIKTHILIAACYYMKEDYAAAEKALASIYKQNPNDGDILSMMALIKARQGLAEDGMQYMLKAFDQENANDYLSRKLRFYCITGDAATARSVFKQVITEGKISSLDLSFWCRDFGFLLEEPEVLAFFQEKLEFFPSLKHETDNEIPCGLLVPKGSARESYAIIKEKAKGMAAEAKKNNPQPTNTETKETPSLTVSSNVDIPPTVNLPALPNRFALVIGNQNYTNLPNGAVAPVFALNDAQTMKNYCAKRLRTPEDNIIYLADADSAKLRMAFKQLQLIAKNSQTTKPEMIVYYSGLGVINTQKKTAAFLTVDGCKNITINDLYENLTAFSLEKAIVIIDAPFVNWEEPSTKIKVNDNVFTPSKGNIWTIHSSKLGQKCALSTSDSHSLFTYFLLKKLKEDKIPLDLRTLSEYVSQQIAVKAIMLTGEEQTPTINNSFKVDGIWKEWRF